jgi:aryl-alcohol dehydrogenase-like predicted oxidoreductase
MPDADVPIAETLGALHDLVRAGKVREIGCSNFSAPQIADAAGAAADANTTPFRSLQNEWSLLQRAIEPDVLEAARKHGLGVLPYFPLASGLLTGKYQRGEAPAPGTRLALFGDRAKGMMTDERFDLVERLQSFAEARERSLLELAISWLASHEDVASVIAGATSAEQIAANVDAGSWRLSPDEMAEVDQIVPIAPR